FEGLSQALNVMHGERGVGTGLERREHVARCGFVLDEQNTEWRSFVYAYWCGARDLTVRIGEHVGGSPGGCSHPALPSYHVRPEGPARALFTRDSIRWVILERPPPLVRGSPAAGTSLNCPVEPGVGTGDATAPGRRATRAKREHPGRRPLRG